MTRLSMTASGQAEGVAAPRILLVDDDDSFRGMLQAMLERLGHEVAVAKNGFEAVAQYRDRPAELVITDLIMPGAMQFTVMPLGPSSWANQTVRLLTPSLLAP